MVGLSESPQRSTRPIYGALVGLTLFAAVLRFYHLGAESLWFDELATWHDCLSFSFKNFLTGRTFEPMPPGYYLMISNILNWFGDSEWWLRFPSALAGNLCVPALFLLGRRFFSMNTGLACAAIGAVFYPLVFHSQDARPYIFVFLFTTLTAASLRCLLDSDLNRRREFAVFFMLNGVLMELQYLALALSFFFSTLLLVKIVRHHARQTWRWYLSGIALQAALAALSLQNITFSLRDAHLFLGWIPAPNLKSWLDLFYWALGGFGAASIFALIGTLVLGWRLLHWRRLEFRTRRSIWLALTWIALPTFAIWVKSEFSSYSLFWPRQFTIVLPAFFLLIAEGSNRLFRSRWPILLAGLWCVFGTWQLVGNLRYYSTPQKQQWRELVSLLNAKDKPMTIFLHEPGFAEYYLRHLGDARKKELRFLPFSNLETYEAIPVKGRIGLILDNPDLSAEKLLHSRGLNIVETHALKNLFFTEWD